MRTGRQLQQAAGDCAEFVRVRPQTCYHRQSGAGVKIRSRKFEGRCARHKRYNPAVDGRGAIKGACPRCSLLFDIWESSLRLNQLIRKFDPQHDDLQRPAAPKEPAVDPRQLSLI
jgi:hypothetical protein